MRKELPVGFTQGFNRKPYWLLVKSLDKEMKVLSTGLPGGGRALPVFSFEEEAEMFLCLQGSRDGWQVRETGPGELLSMFYTVLKDVGWVTLDPIPENSCLNTSGLLSVSRTDFMARLLGANVGGKAARKRWSDAPGFGVNRLAPGSA